MTEMDRLEVLGKKYAPEILAATAEPKTAMAISDQLDIPIATCYRRIDQLQEHDLLEVANITLSEQRQRCQQYQRTIDRIMVTFDAAVATRFEEAPDGISHHTS